MLDLPSCFKLWRARKIGDKFIRCNLRKKCSRKEASDKIRSIIRAREGVKELYKLKINGEI